MNIVEQIRNLNLTQKYLVNVSLAKNSWFGVGGKCSILFKPSDTKELSDFVSRIPQDIPILTIGVTSNLLIRDEGFKGIIIRPKFLEMKLIDPNGKTIIVGSSLLDVNVAKFAADNGISGLEFLYTIPGTIGGAISMNAGCYGSEMSDIFVSASGVNRFTGEIKTFSKEEMNFSYRYSGIRDYIWINATLRGNKSKTKEEIYQTMNKLYSQRIESQPKSCKTGGSTFCNPEGHQAWKLIEEVGLRGYRIGGACFSDKHCNFIINDQNAKSHDIIDLIELAEKKVFEKFGVKLEREIVIV